MIYVPSRKDLAGDLLVGKKTDFSDFHSFSPMNQRVLSTDYDVKLRKIKTEKGKITHFKETGINKSFIVFMCAATCGSDKLTVQKNQRTPMQRLDHDLSYHRQLNQSFFSPLGKI